MSRTQEVAAQTVVNQIRSEDSTHTAHMSAHEFANLEARNKRRERASACLHPSLNGEVDGDVR